jgi:hypothetical protein
LSDQQVRRLEHELRRGAFARGYAGDYWTLDWVGQLIWQLFAVRRPHSGLALDCLSAGGSSRTYQKTALYLHEIGDSNKIIP